MSCVLPDMDTFVQLLEYGAEFGMEILWVQRQFFFQEVVRQTASAGIQGTLPPHGAVSVLVLFVPGATHDLGIGSERLQHVRDQLSQRSLTSVPMRANIVGAPVARQASDCRLIPPQIWKPKSQFDDNGSYLLVFRRRSAAFLRVFTVSVSSLYLGPMTGMYHCDASLAGPAMMVIVMSDLSSTREHQGSPAICFKVACDCSARDTRLPPARTSLRILYETFSLAVFGSSPGHSTTFKGTFPWVAALTKRLATRARWQCLGSSQEQKKITRRLSLPASTTIFRRSRAAVV